MTRDNLEVVDLDSDAVSEAAEELSDDEYREHEERRPVTRHCCSCCSNWASLDDVPRAPYSCSAAGETGGYEVEQHHVHDPEVSSYVRPPQFPFPANVCMSTSYRFYHPTILQC